MHTTINVLIIASLLRVLFATSAMAKSSLRKKAASGLRSLGTLLPVLGVTWLFGILSVNEKTEAFQYAFVIANSLQGFFIFVSHVLLKRKVMLGLRNRYPVLKTFDSLIETSKMERSSFSRTQSSSRSTVSLQKINKHGMFEKPMRRNGQRNKADKSESFSTEKAVSTEVAISDGAGKMDGMEMSDIMSFKNKLELILEKYPPKLRMAFPSNVNSCQKKIQSYGNVKTHAKENNYGHL